MQKRPFRSLTSLLLVCLALSGLAEAQIPTARKVMDDMVVALGGQKFLDVDDIQMTGRVYVFKRGDLDAADVFVDSIRFPEMERTEIGKDKRKTTTINKGPEGWIIEGKDAKKIEPQSAVQARDFLLEFRTSFDYVTRFVLDQPKTTQQHVGTDIMDFKRVDIIEVRDPVKNLIRFYVDRTSHLPLKYVVRRVDEAELHEELYNNWHAFQGIMSPTIITRSTNNLKNMEIHVENVTFDSGLPDSLFSNSIVTSK